MVTYSESNVTNQLAGWIMACKRAGHEVQKPTVLKHVAMTLMPERLGEIKTYADALAHATVFMHSK